MVWKIFRPRYWILDRKVRSTNRFIIIGLIAAVALGGQWIYNNWLRPNFELLNSEQLLTLISSFIPMGIFILLLFALLGIGDITYQLYQSADTELMMTAPIPFRTIFLVKLLQSSRSTLVPGLFFTLLLVVFGAAQDVSPLYYLFIVLIIISAIVLVTSIVMLIVILLARLLPSQRLRSWMPVAVGLITLVLALFQQPITQWFFSQPALMTALMNSIFDISRLTLITILSMGLAVLSAVITYLVFYRSFHEGWNRFRQVPSRRSDRSTAAGSRRSGPAQWLQPIPVPLRSFLVKEWLVIRRDPRGLLNLAQPLIFIVIIIAPFLINGSWQKTLQPILFWLILIYLAFFLSIIPVGTPLLALAEEGSNISLLRSTPTSMSAVLKSKFWATWIPVVLSWVIVFLLAGVLLQFPLWQIGIISGIIIYGLGGATFLTLAIGSQFIDFSREEVKRRIPLPASYLIMGLNAFFMILVTVMGILLMVELLPESNAVLVIRVLSEYPMIGWVFSDSIWLPIILLGTQVISWLAIRYLWVKGIQRLEQMEIS